MHAWSIAPCRAWKTHTRHQRTRPVSVRTVLIPKLPARTGEDRIAVIAISAEQEAFPGFTSQILKLLSCKHFWLTIAAQTALSLREDRD